MNMVVCLKQVPGTNKVEVDEKTGVLKRDGVESKMNPFDLYALETALRIRERAGGSITAVTMGPPQAEAIIREAFMMGVDDGYVFSDRKFAGADVLATSYTLSQGTWVSKIDKFDDKKIVVEQDMADSTEEVEIEYPCLITVEKDIMQPRLPSYRRKLETLGRPVKILAFKDFADQDEKKYGLSGSPTQVERIFPPEPNTSRILWEGSCRELTDKCFNTMKQLKFI